MEYGLKKQDDAPTVILISGGPGSRFFTHPSINKLKEEGKEKELGIRLISFERPGFGLSTPDPNVTLLSIADDVTEFADILGIKKFGIIGYSAGGPSTLACLYKLGDRITGAALISSVSPKIPGASKNMGFMFKLAYWASANAHWMISSIVTHNSQNYLKDPVKQGREDFGNFSKNDGDFYKQHPEVEKMFIESGLEFYSRPHAAATESREYFLWTMPWGFDLKDIKCKNVTIYNGTEDKGCTIEMAQYIHKNIEESESNFVENKGHFLYFDIWESIMQKFRDLAKESNPKSSKKQSKKKKEKEEVSDEEYTFDE